MIFFIFSSCWKTFPLFKAQKLCKNKLAFKIITIYHIPSSYQNFTSIAASRNHNTKIMCFRLPITTTVILESTSFYSKIITTVLHKIAILPQVNKTVDLLFSWEIHVHLLLLFFCRLLAKKSNLWQLLNQLRWCRWMVSYYHSARYSQLLKPISPVVNENIILIFFA